MMQPVAIALDRSIRVPAGKVVKTGYVDVFACRLACRDRMAVGDVSAAYQKLLQCGPDQPFPCPNGFWQQNSFIIQDGRHAYVAALMLGWSHLLVAWIE